MAFIKLLKKAAKAGAKKLTKKKSKKSEIAKTQNRVIKTARDVAKDKKLKTKLQARSEKEKGGQLKGPKTRGKEQMRKLIGEPKNTKAEKVVGKRSTKKDTKKDTKKRVPKKSDRRIEGSGKFSARPPGSKGKASVKADSPRGGTTGVSMKDARKKQMRDTANLDSEMKRLGRKYDDLPKGVKRTILMAIRSKDSAKIKKAMRGTNMTASEFVKVFNKRGKM